MGCTSSAPNMAYSSTAEKSIQFEEENSEDQKQDVEEIIYRTTNETNVLPPCDNIPEPVHLSRNKSTPSLETEKDNPEDSPKSENVNKVESHDAIHEEKVIRLEDVVEKVIEIHKTEHVDDTQPVEKVAEEPPHNLENIQTDKHSLHDENDADKPNKNTETDKLDKEKVDDVEEALSPSQSESSRATRWEALADIAAELPPTLTVDPITGQIYSFSK